ncbi:MAG TPA: cell envelope integrity protein TolA [Chitinophagales bacterium]|jgi:outer membrane biosynthesis protein TonB|nr:cell envelope integrity protein TolA [Chitinophagales bacterium]MBP6154425.1 cell envelope integrity protein TolA [Chitinophagales bacterium]HQV78981.1 cell envelope integrity protein TolA [Chitinophagales bacterium]HQW79977.1 cell envelope integrity protein TolA [Chitinophagales bacterium]
MSNAIQLQQSKSNQQSFVITAVMLIALLLSLMFVYLPHPLVQDKIDGVIIDFGDSETGLGDDNLREAGGSSAQQTTSTPEPIPTPPTATPTKTPTAPKTPQNSVLSAEDAQAVAIVKLQKEEKIKQQKALLEQQRIAEAVKQAEQERLAREAEEKKIKNQMASAWTKGKNNTGSGSGNGNGNASGNGPGNGAGNGSPGGNSGSPNGTPGGSPNGGGNSAGYNLAGRTWKPYMIKDDSQKTGKVVVMIKVDRNGNVLYAKYQQKGSTTSDLYLIKLAEEGAMKTKFSANSTAVEEQVGTITYKFGFTTQ